MATTEKPANAEPDYTEEPAAFLLFHKWRPLGPVKSPRTKWIDPTKPWPEGTHTKIPVYSKDQDGNIDKQMHKDEKGKSVHTHQVLYSPPAVPMLLEDAVQVQVERDMRAEMKKLSDQEKERQKGK